MKKHQFQTEVNQLLSIIIHSLYSHKEIFLRELVSNASDALDKLKYLNLTDEKYKDIPFDPRIDISFDEEGASSLVVADNGIGMNEQDLMDNLGTIARSGTKDFLSRLTGDKTKDVNLIGQFGMGFYSSFMAADKVEVITRKAGEDETWVWISDGKGEFEISPGSRDTQGTTIKLYLNDEGKEFASRYRIENVVQKYSNHIPFPIYLAYTKNNYDEQGKETTKEPVTEKINAASALWKQAKSALNDEEYQNFYKTLGHDMDPPLFHLHTQAEGTMEYTTLFFVPQKAPFDMFNVDYRPGVKLYVKRVFITDDDKELLPPYLRFVRGVIDSEDLPLNVSREMLQQNRVLANIKSTSVKRLLGEFERIASEEPEKYDLFIKEYNRPLKEGLYSDFARRDTLLDLVRFKSTKAEGYTSLKEYKERMGEDQKAIYYITGDNEQTLRNSPLLEAHQKRDIEVLIMDDEIDELVVPSLGKYQDIELKAVNRSDAGEDLKDKTDEAKEQEARPVVEMIKKALGDHVKDVKTSVRLSDSPACVVLDENDPSIKMQQMMKAFGQKDLPAIKPILEVNPDHHILKHLKDITDTSLVEDISFLLYEQALLVEGSELKDPSSFVKRLNRIMQKAI